jgi:hypothetical protein
MPLLSCGVEEGEIGALHHEVALWSHVAPYLAQVFLPFAL